LIEKIPVCQEDKSLKSLLHPPIATDQLKGSEQQEAVHNFPTKNAISGGPLFVDAGDKCEGKMKKRDLGGELRAIRNVPNLSQILLQFVNSSAMSRPLNIVNLLDIFLTLSIKRNTHVWKKNVPRSAGIRAEMKSTHIQNMQYTLTKNSRVAKAKQWNRGKKRKHPVTLVVS
jgi:hypothetical protein